MNPRSRHALSVLLAALLPAALGGCYVSHPGGGPGSDGGPRRDAGGPTLVDASDPPPPPPILPRFEAASASLGCSEFGGYAPVFTLTEDFLGCSAAPSAPTRLRFAPGYPLREFEPAFFEIGGPEGFSVELCFGGACRSDPEGEIVVHDYILGEIAVLEYNLRLPDGRTLSGIAELTDWCWPDEPCEVSEPFTSGISRPDCAPDDGPAHRFQLFSEPGLLSCDHASDRSLDIYLYEGLADMEEGRLFDIPSQGSVARCDLRSCQNALAGTVIVEFFARGEVAYVYYELDFGGGMLSSGGAEILSFCPALFPGCG